MDPRVKAALEVLPACEWCKEKPEVGPGPDGGVGVTIAHQRDCATTRHPKLGREYRKAVARALQALEQAARRQHSGQGATA